MYSIELSSMEKFVESIDKCIENTHEDSIANLIEFVENNLKNVSDKFYKNSLKVVFYKKIINVCKSLNNNALQEILLSIVVKNTSDIIINDFDSYMLKMDSYILLAIDYYVLNKYSNSHDMFEKITNFGEVYIEYSRKNYFDALNCAYSWLVYYLYISKRYDEVRKCCELVISHYNEVKNDPKYHVNEKESVKTCEKYLATINQLLK